MSDPFVLEVFQLVHSFRHSVTHFDNLFVAFHFLRQISEAIDRDLGYDLRALVLSFFNFVEANFPLLDHLLEIRRMVRKVLKEQQLFGKVVIVALIFLNLRLVELFQLLTNVLNLFDFDGHSFVEFFGLVVTRLQSHFQI